MGRTTKKSLRTIMVHMQSRIGARWFYKLFDERFPSRRVLVRWFKNTDTGRGKDGGQGLHRFTFSTKCSMTKTAEFLWQAKLVKSDHPETVTDSMFMVM